MSKTKEPKYNVEVKYRSKWYKASGDTIDEAITKLSLGNVISSSVWLVKKGKQSKERVIMPGVAKRVLATRGLVQQVALKQFNALFDL